MPLPLGHSAIGMAVHELSAKDTGLTRWKNIAFITLLANLPDLDVVVGLLLRDNGSAFHRGPTHSLLFALAMALAASRAGKAWAGLPRFRFGICFLVVFSHVLSDLFLTSAPVSLLWPLEVNWSLGHSGWTDVLNTVFLGVFRDAGVIVICTLVVLAKHAFWKIPRYRRLVLAVYHRHRETKIRF